MIPLFQNLLSQDFHDRVNAVARSYYGANKASIRAPRDPQTSSLRHIGLSQVSTGAFQGPSHRIWSAYDRVGIRKMMARVESSLGSQDRMGFKTSPYFFYFLHPRREIKRRNTFHYEASVWVGLDVREDQPLHGIWVEREKSHVCVCNIKINRPPLEGSISSYQPIVSLCLPRGVLVLLMSFHLLLLLGIRLREFLLHVLWDVDLHQVFHPLFWFISNQHLRGGTYTLISPYHRYKSHRGTEHNRYNDTLFL